MSTTSGIRKIKMRRGSTGSITHTVALTVSKTSIGTTFADPKVYAKQPPRRQEAFSDATDYASVSGLEAAGAKSIELAGGFHSSNRSDKFEHLTATIRDQQGQRMYFYRKSDGSFWERVHIPKRNYANAYIWHIPNDYVSITKRQFENKQAPIKRKSL